MMQTFREFFLNEITDSRRNREALINAYGLTDDAEAADVIAKWNKYEPLIDTDPETYGFPRNVRNLNPRDIFAWSRALKHNGETDTEHAKGNLMTMLNDLQSVFDHRSKQKEQLDDYETLYSSDMLTVFKPNSEGASCKLGAGTKWCTAATKSKNMFDDYTKRKGVKLYYFHTKHEGKYALAIYPTGETEVYDEEDQQIRIDDLYQTVRDHGADLNKIIKVPTVLDTLQSFCDQYMSNVKQTHPDENAILSMDELADDILHYARKAAAYTKSDYAQFRQKTQLPDMALLSHKGMYHYWTDTGTISDRNGDDMVSPQAVSFFMDPSLNPDGSMPETNKQFQRQVESTVLNHIDSVARDLENYEPDEPFASYQDVKTQFVADIKNTLGKLVSYVDDHDQLLYYSKRHTGGNWKSLHDLVFDLIAERPTQVVGNSISAGLLMFVMREKGGRWEEVEKLIGDIISQENKKGWSEENHTILRFSEFYNRMIAGLKGSNDIVKYLPGFSDMIPINR